MRVILTFARIAGGNFKSRGMKKYQKFLLFSLIGFVAFPTITLGSTFVSSLIQGKTVEEAVQILAEQIDSLIGRVEKVEIKQSEQEQSISNLQSIIEQQNKEILCQQLIKQTLQVGEISYMNVDIVKFYQKNQDILFKKEQFLSYLKTLPTFTDPKSGEIIVRDPKTGQNHSLDTEEGDVNFFKAIASEAKSLYENYIHTCEE